MTGVGRSDSRTPGKHTLLNKTAGREIGAGPFVREKHPTLRFDRQVFIDLCAGDGVEDAASGESSPQIFAKHSRHTPRLPLDVILVEKRQHIAMSLRRSVAGMEFGVNPHIISGDARSASVIAEIARIVGTSDRVSVLLNNDPNSIKDFALSGELLDALPMSTTTISTLGCNVSGLKRLGADERQAWYRHVDLVTSSMSSHHDAILVALNQDAAQWAYLVTAPAAWHARVEGDVNKAFKDWPKGLSTAWFRTQRTGFADICDRLFTTKAERAAS